MDAYRNQCMCNGSKCELVHVYTAQQCPNGFVQAQCLSCGNRPLTCADVLNNRACLFICTAGCDCPRGKVLDEKTGHCVENCSAPSCPIRGQVFKECVECPGNPFTCANPNHLCSRICVQGCECPNGEVLDTRRRRCVPLQLCSRGY